MTTEPLTPLTSAVFPSAGSAHVWYAQDAGIFRDFGLDVDVIAVRSSAEQTDLWDTGRLDAMHTSADHLLRGRERDPVAVVSEGIGPLAVYARPERQPGRSRWAVDGAQSAFALVLRAILDHHGIPYAPGDLVEVGGTGERLTALTEGRVDGTTLHTPFDAVAASRGFERIGDHAEILPALVPVVAVVDRAHTGTPKIQQYVRALATSRARLIEQGAGEITSTLQRRGWDATAALRGAETMLGPYGFSLDRVDPRDAVEVAAGLRARMTPGWKPERPPAEYAALVDGEQDAG